MTYAITETNGSIQHAKWTDIDATSLTAAKRAASREQSFQGTTVAVAIKGENGYTPVAVKADDPINMNAKGKWEDA